MLNVTEDDVALSFLPLSHAFERMVAYVYLLCGVTIVFAESFDTIGRDIGRVRPTVLTGVPRVYEKLHDRILEKGQAAPGLKGALFRWAIGAGDGARATRELRGQVGRPRSASLQAPLADRSCSRRSARGVGGRLRYLVSGSAPLPADIAEFFQGLGLPIIEGYGLTETVADPDGQSARRAARRHRRPGAARRRAADRRRRRDPRARAERHAGLSTTSPRRRPRR